MDHHKTGALIRSRRIEKGMTQKELADVLHITNSAVSKWERGLSAPDIALLPPLAGALGITVTELIGGELSESAVEEIEKSVQDAIHYSANEVAHKTRFLRRTAILAAVSCSVLAVLICLGFLWMNGTFHVIDRVPSPDGRSSLIIYDRDIHGLSVGSPAVTLQERGGAHNTVYGNCTYEGAWWAPDSKKFVIALNHSSEGAMVFLNNIERNSSSNLTAYLSMAVMESELAEYGLPDSDGVFPQIDYHFLQWSEDSNAMLIHYFFEDVTGRTRSGYFWYSLTDGNIYGILELEE